MPTRANALLSADFASTHKEILDLKLQYKRAGADVKLMSPSPAASPGRAPGRAAPTPRSFSHIPEVRAPASTK